MTKKNTSNENRKRIIDSYNGGENIKTLSGVLNINVETIKGIIKVYKNSDRIESLRRGGLRHEKLSTEEIAMIKSWIDQDCTLTLERWLLRLEKISINQ